MKTLKRWWKWVVIPLVIVILVILSLPTLVGTKWVYQSLLDRLSAEDFKVSIESVQVGWFQPIAFKNIQLTTTSTGDASRGSASMEETLLSIRSIQSNRTVVGFLLGGRNLGTIEVIEPEIDIKLLEEGSNLERLIRAVEGKNQPANASPKKTPPKMDVRVVVRGLSVKVSEEDPKQPIVVVPPFDADIEYKSLDQDSVVSIGPSKILNNVKITPELVRLGLAKAVPLLAKSAWFDGSVSLETQKIMIPIQHPEDSTGKAQLTLHEVRSGPSDPTIITAIDLMGRLFQKEIVHELVFVDGSQIQLEVAEQQVKHSGVRAGLPRLDPRMQLASAGSVGLVDKKLNVALEIPVPVEHVAFRNSVKSLGVPSISLPIRGTLDDPELDWNTLRKDSAGLLTAISGVLKDDAPIVGNVVGALSEVADGKADEAIGAGVDLVKDLWKLRQEKLKSQRQAEEDKAKETDTPNRSRPFRDALKNILRGKD